MNKKLLAIWASASVIVSTGINSSFAATGDLFDTVNNITGTGLDGTNQLLDWEVGTVIAFLIWFTILSLVIYKLNQVFGWFGWRK